MFDANLDAAARIGDVAVFLGTAIALFLLVRRHGWKGVPIVALTLVTGIYGARLWGSLLYGHVPLRSDIWWRAASWHYSANYRYASMVGGVLGGILAVVVIASLLRLPRVAVLGTLTPGVAAAQAVGRIQCYVIGCCFGKPTKLPWGVVFPADTYAGFLSGPIPLHPTQLYESILDGALFLVLWQLVTRSRECNAGVAYLVGYGAIRFCVEFFRVGRDAHFVSLSSAQWVSLGLVVAGIGIWSKITSHAVQRRSVTR